MRCERCGEREGDIRYTEYAEGEMKKLLICRECASELGFGAGPEAEAGEDPPPDAGQVLGLVSLQAALGDTLTPPSEPDERRCPACGATAADLDKQSLFGCPECYVVFAGSLEPLLRRVQGNARHRGRLPGGRFLEGEGPAPSEAPDPPGEFPPGTGPEPDPGAEE